MAAPNFVSIFSGAGGLDLGFEQAGWKCRYASDIDPKAVDCLKANLPRQCASNQQPPFIEQSDVRDLTGADILAKAGGLKKGDVPLLLGGPPCQSFSSAGHQLGLADPRGQLFADFVRLAGEIDTRWLVFENVRGLLTARGPDGVPGSALALIRRALLDAGYQTTVRLLNAADFGAPQRRVRLFIVGFRSGDAPDFPTPTHAKTTDPESGLLPWKTLKTCLSEIAKPKGDEIILPKGKLANELKMLPEGTGVKSPGKPERTRPGGHWGYKQGAFIANRALPSRTITASGQQDWIRDPKHGLRRLSPRECSAIQTFPTDWVWGPKNSVNYRLIGNAVPPLLGHKIGEALMQTYKNSGTEVADTKALLPLEARLEAAINYTMKEERSNGASRRAAPARKRIRVAV